jgi:hypothetical protein
MSASGYTHAIHKASGSPLAVGTAQEQETDRQRARNETTAITINGTSEPPGAGDERRQMMRSGRIERSGHKGSPFQ